MSNLASILLFHETSKYFIMSILTKLSSFDLGCRIGPRSILVLSRTKASWKAGRLFVLILSLRMLCRRGRAADRPPKRVERVAPPKKRRSTYSLPDSHFLSESRCPCQTQGKKVKNFVGVESPGSGTPGVEPIFSTRSTHSAGLAAEEDVLANRPRTYAPSVRHINSHRQSLCALSDAALRCIGT